jgi:hypothetical protein
LYKEVNCTEPSPFSKASLLSPLSIQIGGLLIGAR